MKILVTGASGFIGSFIVDRALELGHDVWVGMRQQSSWAWLPRERVNVIDFDQKSPDAFRRSLEIFKEKEGRWDCVIHAAGATKAKNETGFMRTNLDGTRMLVQALKEMNLLAGRFVFMSSLSVLGDLKGEKGAGEGNWHYAAMTADDEPQPNTAYGRSKHAAELYLEKQSDWLNYVILRPTGVYGPREKDYFLMAKSIKNHIDFSVGYQPQELTFIYVEDLVDAVFLAHEHGKSGSAYLLSDGNTYNSADFSNLLQKYMGISPVMHLKAPLWVLKALCYIGEFLSRKTGKPSVFNKDKYKILKQRNWRCDISKAVRDLGYNPRFSLEEGVKRTVMFYKKENWL